MIDEALAAPRAVTEHRDGLVRTRTQTVNRLHVLLAQLISSGLPRKLTAGAAAAAMRTIRPRTVLARTLRRLAVELLTDLRRLDRRITEATATFSATATASGTTLTQLHGVADVMAAKILARTGSVSRFRSESAFASFCGVAPIEVSFGRRPTASPLASRRPPAQLRPARHGHE
ncbi:transposase [Actinoplanes sp. CA-030573]|uniref:transposase n=1 Tax=Actinoplanes sp. CA-030573 TaxID=3239898 RepID=UPI003D9465AF